LLEAVFIAILSSSIAVLMGSIAAKLMLRKEIEQQKQWFFAFLKSEDGINTIATAGKLFGAGALSTVGGSPKTQNMNIFGMKIPTSVVMALIQQFAPNALKKASNIPGFIEG